MEKKGYLEVLKSLGRWAYSIVTLDAFLPEEQPKPMKDPAMQGTSVQDYQQRMYEATRPPQIDVDNQLERRIIGRM